MMLSDYGISDCLSPPDRAEMDDLLGQYYSLMIERLNGAGIEASDAGGLAIQEFWDEVDKFLPPQGRLFLARDPDGTLVGCGMLKSVGNNKGELKRLFVKPEARGTGLGRRLVELRLDAAREMGLRELLVDTLKANVEMRGLYAKLGFSEIQPYAESSTLRMESRYLPAMCFFSMKI